MEDNLRTQLLSAFSDDLPPQSAEFLNRLVESICTIIEKGQGENEIEEAIGIAVDSTLRAAESSVND